jgi:hypothetical protein
VVVIVTVGPAVVGEQENDTISNITANSIENIFDIFILKLLNTKFGRTKFVDDDKHNVWVGTFEHAPTQI